MTPEEFAAQTGLSLEEAEMVLSARAVKAVTTENWSNQLSPAMSRLQRAMIALMSAEQKVGVKPYEESK